MLHVCFISSASPLLHGHHELVELFQGVSSSPFLWENCEEVQ